MASARHRSLPSSTSSSRNPFDSSDEEDEGKRGAPSVASRNGDYSNPFADEEGHGGARAVGHNPTSRPPRSKQPQTEAYPKNPFDDDEAHVKNPFDDDYDDDDRSAQQSRPSLLKAKLDKGTLFDEEPRFHGNLGLQEHKSKMKSPANSALKKVQRFKDSGVSQASRIVEGGLHQAQKLKESSFNAFKSGEGNVEGSSSKGVLSGNVQNQLLGEDGRRGPVDKGAHRVYNKGQGLSNEGSGLYETGFFGTPSRATPHYDDHQFQGADLEQRSIQELEGYAVQKSEDTTKRLQNCLKVAEDIKGDATRTLVSLHQQGEQLRRTHEVAYDIDQNLAAGEKLLGSLGGMFSRTWKPKRGPAVKGPVDDPSDFHIRRKGHHLEQQTALGLDVRRHSDHLHSVPNSQPQITEAKLEMEKTKQDDALSDLSNVLDQLKEMSIDMGSEIARQNVAVDHFQNDVVTLDERVKGANVRGRRLLGK